MPPACAARHGGIRRARARDDSGPNQGRPSSGEGAWCSARANGAMLAARHKADATEFALQVRGEYRNGYLLGRAQMPVRSPTT